MFCTGEIAPVSHIIWLQCEPPGLCSNRRHFSISAEELYNVWSAIVLLYTAVCERAANAVYPSPASTKHSISTTAAYGDVTRGPRIITDETRAEMKKILGEIQSGSFAKEFILENKANRPMFNALLRKGKEHRVEQVGEKLRKMMPFVGKKLQ